MKKKFLALLLVSALALSASACGKSSSKGADSTTSSAGTQSAKTESTASAGTESVTPMPTPELTEAEKALLDIEIVETEISADTIDSLIELAEYKGLPLVVENGVTANIAFSGTVEGEDAPREGMTSDSTDLTIGSGSFIDGFEDALVGTKVGETKEFDLAFPDPYTGNEDLSGKMTKWTVTINSIDLLNRVTENSTIKAFPKDLYDEMKALIEADIKAYAEMYQLEYDEFISTNGINVDLETRKLLPNRLTAKGILVKEGIYTSDPLTSSESVYVDALADTLRKANAATVDDAVAAGISKELIINAAEKRAANKLIQIYGV